MCTEIESGWSINSVSLMTICRPDVRLNETLEVYHYRRGAVSVMVIGDQVQCGADNITRGVQYRLEGNEGDGRSGESMNMRSLAGSILCMVCNFAGFQL